MQPIWRRIEAQLQLLAPRVREHLQPGASEDTLRRVEEYISIELPEEVKAVYQVHDGQADRNYFCENTGLVNGWFFVSLQRMCHMWLCAWNDLGPPGSTYNSYFSCPTQECYPAIWHPHWLPFMVHWTGPTYCIDLAPGPNGKMGQILFYNDRYKRYPDPLEPVPSIRVVAPSIREFLATLANDLEAGIYQFDEASGILWSKEAFSTMRKEYLDFLAQERQMLQKNDFPVCDDPGWDELNRERPRESFSVPADIGPDGLAREYSDEREEPIGLDALFEAFPDEFPDDTFPGTVWLM